MFSPLICFMIVFCRSSLQVHRSERSAAGTRLVRHHPPRGSMPRNDEEQGLSGAEATNVIKWGKLALCRTYLWTCTTFIETPCSTTSTEARGSKAGRCVDVSSSGHLLKTKKCGSKIEHRISSRLISVPSYITFRCPLSADYTCIWNSSL